MSEDRELVGFTSKVLNSAIGIYIPELDEIERFHLRTGAKTEPIEEYISTVGVIALYPARIMLQGLNKPQTEALVQELYEFVIERDPKLRPRLTVIHGGKSDKTDPDDDPRDTDPGTDPDIPEPTGSRSRVG